MPALLRPGCCTAERRGGLQAAMSGHCQHRCDPYTALAQDMSCHLRVRVAPFVDIGLVRKSKPR